MVIVIVILVNVDAVMVLVVANVRNVEWDITISQIAEVCLVNLFILQEMVSARMLVNELVKKLQQKSSNIVHVFHNCPQRYLMWEYFTLICYLYTLCYVCLECKCDPKTTNGDVCQKDTGACRCKIFYKGPNCEKCSIGYYRHPRCYGITKYFFPKLMVIVLYCFKHFLYD